MSPAPGAAGGITIVVLVDIVDLMKIGVVRASVRRSGGCHYVADCEHMIETKDCTDNDCDQQ
jgi:hypothetical protein